MISNLAAFLSLASLAASQQVGTQQTETHPSLSWSQCTASGCSTKSGSVVVDANWRWLHDVNGTENCYDGMLD
jgi:cellulose 1,4-beta-cellobiosidase